MSFVQGKVNCIKVGALHFAEMSILQSILYSAEHHFAAEHWLTSLLSATTSQLCCQALLHHFVSKALLCTALLLYWQTLLLHHFVSKHCFCLQTTHWLSQFKFVAGHSNLIFCLCHIQISLNNYKVNIFAQFVTLGWNSFPSMTIGHWPITFVHLLGVLTLCVS